MVEFEWKCQSNDSYWALSTRLIQYTYRQKVDEKRINQSRFISEQAKKLRPRRFSSYCKASKSLDYFGVNLYLLHEDKVELNGIECSIGSIARPRRYHARAPRQDHKRIRNRN